MLVYKVLAIRNSMLHSPYAHYLWTKDYNKAECQWSPYSQLAKPTSIRKYENEPCKLAPEATCACGFYGYLDVEYTPKINFLSNPVSKRVFTLLNAYGKILEHVDNTVRAEYMSIVAITSFDSHINITKEELELVSNTLLIPSYYSNDYEDSLKYLRYNAKLFMEEYSVE